MAVAYLLQGAGWIGVLLSIWSLSGDVIIAATKADGPDWLPAAALSVGSLLVVGLGVALHRLILIERHLAVAAPSSGAKKD